MLSEKLFFTPFRRFGQAAAATIMLALVGTAAAQNAPPAANAEPTVRLTREQAADFHKALQTMATQTRLAFVVEGEPLRPILPVKDAPPLKADETLSKAVDVVSEAYDYEAQRQGSVFILKKRYTDSADLPCLSSQECLAALQDVDHILSPFNPRVPPVGRLGTKDSLVGALVASFSPPQLQALQQPGGLSLAALTQEQQALVWRFALHFYIQYPGSAAMMALRRLDKPSKIVFQWQNIRMPSRPITYIRAFGYEGPDPLAPEKPLFEMLSQPGGSRSSLTAPRLLAGNHKPMPFAAPADPTLPTADAKKDDHEQAIPTLRDAVNALNIRAGRTLFLADASLQTKPVSITGAEYAAPESVFRCLASLYGLRVKTEETGEQRLTRPPLRLPLGVGAVGKSVREVLPEPFLRALHISQANTLAASQIAGRKKWLEDIAAAQGKENKDSSPMPSKEANEATRKYNGEMKQLREQTEQQQARPAALYTAAIQRVRTLVEPQVARAPEGRVTLNQTGESAQAAFATAQMADVFSRLQQILNRDTPEYITNFNQGFLTGQLGPDEAGRLKMSLFLETRRPDGKTVLGPGVGNVEYIK